MVKSGGGGDGGGSGGGEDDSVGIVSGIENLSSWGKSDGKEGKTIKEEEITPFKEQWDDGVVASKEEEGKRQIDKGIDVVVEEDNIGSIRDGERWIGSIVESELIGLEEDDSKVEAAKGKTSSQISQESMIVIQDSDNPFWVSL